MDSAPAALKVVRKNIKTCGFEDRSACHEKDFVAFLGRVGGKYGLIFLDPPYASGNLERALELICTDFLSVGDYVLTGGELPAMVMIDCISRLIPGVLNNEVSAEVESFHDNLLEYPSIPARKFTGRSQSHQCFFPDTIKISRSGAGSSPSGGPWKGGRTCWKGRSFPGRKRNIWRGFGGKVKKVKKCLNVRRMNDGV